MNKIKKLFGGVLISILLFDSLTLNAAPGLMESSSTVSYTGANTISSDTSNNSESYSSSNGGENALLVSGGTSTITNVNVNKTGDESSESSDFYGSNAAVLVYNGATLNIENGTITTNGSHANAVFAYGTGTINISDSVINTSANNSGGIMVTGGGTLNATNLTVETSGNSSASIRSDRGGGTILVNNGTYKTTGVGSPSIYSTADITINDATLLSEASEGIVIEGANKVTINNTKLVDTNTTLNGQSQTYKNIFLYQSMSGDADEGTSYFTANNSNITTNKGDTFYITNTNAIIALNNNSITNNDKDFLRAEAAAWGTSGSNGGKVDLTLNNQSVEGNIIIDSISTLDMKLTNNSIYRGSINNANEAKNISLTLDSSSSIVLTGDTYLNALNNDVSDNSNIYLNGYSLYVNGEKVSANEEEVPTLVTTSTDTTGTLTTSSNSNDKIFGIDKTLYYGGLGALLVLLVIFLVFNLIKDKKKKIEKKDNEPIETVIPGKMSDGTYIISQTPVNKDVVINNDNSENNVNNQSTINNQNSNDDDIETL